VVAFPRSVTHRNLRLEDPVTAISECRTAACRLFCAGADHSLVHFVMIGAKVGIYDAELRTQLGDAPETRDGLRRHLPSNSFVQFLAGPAQCNFCLIISNGSPGSSRLRLTLT
jgi:hypothetical protein